MAPRRGAATSVQRAGSKRQRWEADGEAGTTGHVQAAYTELLAEGKDVDSEERALIYNNRGHARSGFQTCFIFRNIQYPPAFNKSSCWRWLPSAYG